MPFEFFDPWITRQAQVGFIPDVALNDRTLFKLLLSSETDFDDAFALAAVISRELPLTTDPSYTRFAVTWGSGDAGTYNATTKRHSLAEKEVDLTGDDITFSTAVLLANCTDTVPGVLISSVNASTDLITTSTAHGLSNDDPIMLRFEVGYPTGSNGTTLYYAQVESTTTLKLRDSVGGSEVDLTDTGSGDAQIRFAEGIPVGFVTFESPAFIPDAQTLPFLLTLFKEEA